ncbi:hypothetical protein LG293_16430 (plasmid) [Citricoccus nitrophenolicus]
MSINRHPKGTTSGGRFAPDARPEPNAGLGLTARPHVPSGTVAERMSAAVSLRPGAAALGLKDPNPFVRAATVGSAWDVSAEQRAEAETDHDVNRILVHIGALSPA